MRGSTDVSDQVEFRKSSAMKKCVSGCGVLFAVPAIEGIGGGIPGDTGGDRPVTPGIYAIWMTFDALVRTVDAIECVRLPSPRVRLDWSLFSGGSHVSLRLRGFIQNHHKQKTRMRTTATPPSTPPTIGPIGFDGLDSVTAPTSPLSGIHDVDAQAVHDCGVSEHVSSDEHDGQLG